jgi:hypothetical protein
MSPVGMHSRRNADGEIEYNDDGTIKGFDPDGTSVMMKCIHCDHLKTSNLDEMREHLWTRHPRVTPQAINIDPVTAEQPISLFFCPITSCGFIAAYSNVYKHHMEVEHPDTGGRNKQNKRRSLGGSVRRISSVRDGTFTANLRTGSRKTLVDNVDSLGTGANGDSAVFSPSDSCDEEGKLVDLSTPSRTCLTPDSDAQSSLGLSEGNSSTSKKSSSSYGDTRNFDYSRRYECILCSFVAATLADMKSHLTTKHDPTVAHQCIDRRARQLRKRQGILFCIDAACSFCCKLDKELNAHLEHEHHMTGVSQDNRSLTSSSSPTPAAQSSDEACATDRVYQCSHCTYITTDLHNVRIHVVAEHAATDGGFAEIKTAVGSDGNVIMNVSDQGLGVAKDSSDSPSAFSSVKGDGDGKIYTVL